MILPITAYGDAVLRKECEELEEGADLSKLINDMFETMYDARGVGLAAPQVSKSLRLFVIDAAAFAEDDPESEEEKMEQEFLKTFQRTFINPIIEEETGPEWPFSEGCLSIPGIREEVFRKRDIIISYFDEKWQLKEEKLTGLAARVVQHEYDHIEGVLFTDYLSPLKRRLLKSRLTDISKGQVDVSYKMRFPKKKR
ncbi:MAG: peptide deformylase [Crocinitomicaceae bacterium]|jgi:peptide deformylase|nr:peptide deformylase [Crocinitomicaceae bacterium]